jgi:hypothetical protein
MTFSIASNLEIIPLLSWDSDGNLSITGQSKESHLSVICAIPIDWTAQRHQTVITIRQTIIHINNYIVQLQGHVVVNLEPLELSRLFLTPTGSPNYCLYLNSDNQVIILGQRNSETLHLKFPVSMNGQFVAWLQLLKQRLETLIPARSASRCYLN